MTLETVAAVDDDPLIRELFVETLRDSSYEVQTFASGTQALERFGADPADVVFTDLMMPGLTGLELLEKLRRMCPNTIVVVMTAHHSMDRAIEALRRGAEDYLCKPFTPEQIEVVLAKAAERRRLMSENRYLRGELCGGAQDELVVGRNERMQRLVERVKKVARSKASVLVCGETGTGKELIARALHRSGDRVDKPFIKINCAALAENLLESELFGHEKGAFTGADSRREGRFELADEGTLLLDEISEISPRLQAKLLRALEEEEFERVGGSRTIHVDVRVISTTNRDLAVELREGRFREDLFYRLNVVPVHIPPLRERTEDIPLMAAHFLEMFARANGKTPPRLAPAAMRRLQAYAWPGNVRELKNLMHRAVVMGCDEISLPRKLTDAAPDGMRTRSEIVGRTIEDVERELILTTLDHTSGNKTAAAQLLGVTARTLRNKLGRYRQQAAGRALALGA